MISETAPRVGTATRSALPPAHWMAGSALVSYPEPGFVILTPITPPLLVFTAQVPAKPLPVQPLIPVQFAVAAPPSVYPVPTVVMETDAMPSALQVPAKPEPVHGKVQSADAAPLCVYPLPAFVTSTDATPSAVHVPASPLPVQGSVHVTDIAPLFV